MKNGADLSFMQNAITMEEGKTYAKHLGSFEKQFEKVKNYITKALVKLAKTKPYSTEEVFFNILKNQIEFSDTTSELVDIINISVDKIIEIKKINNKNANRI